MMHFDELLANLTEYKRPAECFSKILLAFSYNSFHSSKSFILNRLRMPNTSELRRKYMCE